MATGGGGALVDQHRDQVVEHPPCAVVMLTPRSSTGSKAICRVVGRRHACMLALESGGGGWVGSLCYV